MLDSTADLLTSLTGFTGIVVFQRVFVDEHWQALAIIAGFYVIEVAMALWRYGKVSSFHTMLAGAAAYSSGIFVLSLFMWGYCGWLFYATVAIYIIELTEEMASIRILPKWRSDVGSIYRVLKAPSLASNQLQSG